MVKLGNFIQGTKSIPAGGDANIVWGVITAGLTPLEISAASYWGGDASETISFGIVSPSISQNVFGVKEWSYYSDRGGIVVCTGGIEGGITQNNSLSLMWNYIRAPASTFYVPPGYTLVMWASHANAAAWNVTFAGFECAEA